MKKLTFGLVLLNTYPLIVSQALATDGNMLEKKDYRINIGAGAIYAPAFLGSKSYQISAVPNINIEYKDKFFASFQQGIGYNLIQSNGWRIGPLAKYAFSRDEDKNSVELRGLGNVGSAWELGGFAEYSWKEWSAKIEARQGVGGHTGFIADFSAGYTKVIPTAFSAQSGPLIVSFGPRATFVDHRYNQAYFGVNQTQSIGSGLVSYSAEAGLLSYGISASAIYPISDKFTITSIVAFDRLAGDAAGSPLVNKLGSENQFTVGVIASYAFGY